MLESREQWMTAISIASRCALRHITRSQLCVDTHFTLFWIKATLTLSCFLHHGYTLLSHAHISHFYILVIRYSLRHISHHYLLVTLYWQTHFSPPVCQRECVRFLRHGTDSVLLQVQICCNSFSDIVIVFINIFLFYRYCLC